MKIGDRVRLTGPMRNPDNPFIPVEDIPVGTEGTIYSLYLTGPREFHQIGVEWDNGSTLSLMPTDSYIVIPQHTAATPS